MKSCGIHLRAISAATSYSYISFCRNHSGNIELIWFTDFSLWTWFSNTWAIQCIWSMTYHLSMRFRIVRRYCLEESLSFQGNPNCVHVKSGWDCSVALPLWVHSLQVTVTLYQMGFDELEPFKSLCCHPLSLYVLWHYVWTKWYRINVHNCYMTQLPV